MKRVLALYYSQTGQLGRSLDSLLSGLDREEFEVHVEAVRPAPPYPFPWSLGAFLDAFPESVLGHPPAIETPEFDPDGEWDLVVLAYTVWYLAPSLPIQGFLASPFARVLRDKPVVTLVACRNMWHTASERMKRDLASLGARHTDNVVVTDAGPTWATFVTTPRWMFTGRSDRFLGVFPPAGVAAETVEGLSRFGAAITAKRELLDARPVPSLLQGLDAVEVEERFVVPELVGRTTFPFWARLVRLGGPPGAPARKPLLFVFAINLILTILVLLPISIVLRILLHPFVGARIRAYVRRLKAPSGVEPEPDYT
jgi:hypothetical protein